MSGDLVKRLRGEYRIPITDGHGPAGGEEPDNPLEHVRTFDVPPINHEAADRIEELEAALHGMEEFVSGILDRVPYEETPWEWIEEHPAPKRARAVFDGTPDERDMANVPAGEWQTDG